jgi:hypothetical protein
MRALIHRAAHFICLITCVLCIGCIAGVVPLPTRTRGITGEEGKQRVHADSIRAQQASRAEVTEKLAWANAGLESDRFFLARWSKSNWGTFAALCGYISCIGAGGERHWAINNALVEFDDQGLVKQFAIFGDSSLAKELSLVAASEKASDFSEPRKIWVDHYWQASFHSAAIILSRGTFEVQESGKKPHNFRIPATKVVRLGPQTVSHDEDLQHTHQVIYFADKTEAGAKMSVRISVPDLLLLLKFVAQDQ